MREHAYPRNSHTFQQSHTCLINTFKYFVIKGSQYICWHGEADELIFTTE